MMAKTLLNFLGVTFRVGSQGVEMWTLSETLRYTNTSELSSSFHKCYL